MAKITRFYDQVSVPATGREFKNIINSYGGSQDQNRWIYSGTIEQIIISMTSGSATDMDIQIRYESQVSSRHKLIYLYLDALLPEHIDSDIKSPFELTSYRNKDGDIHLYIEPNAECVLDIRIDIDINRI